MDGLRILPGPPRVSDRRPKASRCHLSVAALDKAGYGVSEGPGADPFTFRATDYYAGLIDWSDPSDPIRKLIVPGEGEATDFGSLDASNEAANTVVAGLQHKYADTALLLVTDQCAGFCRYCFRKRLFSKSSRETLRDWRPALSYIAAHTGITDVLLSGGDPLTLPTAALSDVVDGILRIPHVRTIRVGSKVPAFHPARITDDPELADLVARVVASGRSFLVMTHFDHPRELTEQAVRALAVLRDAGASCLNQCPVTKGVNDDPAVLAELFQRCTEAGSPQYYVFQCRPTRGNASFVVPMVRVMEIVEAARARVSGLSRRARLCLSHDSGKIEMIGADEAHIFMRFHRAKRPSDAGRIVVYERDDDAFWVDGLALSPGFGTT